MDSNGLQRNLIAIGIEAELSLKEPRNRQFPARGAKAAPALLQGRCQVCHMVGLVFDIRRVVGFEEVRALVLGMYAWLEFSGALPVPQQNKSQAIRVEDKTKKI